MELKEPFLSDRCEISNCQCRTVTGAMIFALLGSKIRHHNLLQLVKIPKLVEQTTKENKKNTHTNTLMYHLKPSHRTCWIWHKCLNGWFIYLLLHNTCTHPFYTERHDSIGQLCDQCNVIRPGRTRPARVVRRHISAWITYFKVVMNLEFTSSILLFHQAYGDEENL